MDLQQEIFVNLSGKKHIIRGLTYCTGLNFTPILGMGRVNILSLGSGFGFFFILFGSGLGFSDFSLGYQILLSGPLRVQVFKKNHIFSS